MGSNGTQIVPGCARASGAFAKRKSKDTQSRVILARPTFADSPGGAGPGGRDTAQDKVLQRILRHSKPHVTKERYMVFAGTVLEAVGEGTDADRRIKTSEGGHQHLQLKFGDGLDLPVTLVAESPRGGGFPHFSTVRSAVGQQVLLDLW